MLDRKNPSSRKNSGRRRVRFSIDLGSVNWLHFNWLTTVCLLSLFSRWYFNLEQFKIKRSFLENSWILKYPLKFRHFPCTKIPLPVIKIRMKRSSCPFSGLKLQNFYGTFVWASEATPTAVDLSLSVGESIKMKISLFSRESAIISNS